MESRAFYLSSRQATPGSSAQVPDLSLPRWRESSILSLCLLSPRDPRQSRWARAGIPTKELPGTKVLFIQQAGHAGKLLALQELQGGASQQSSALPGTH